MSKVTKKDLNERLLMVETLLGLHRALPEQISNDQANNAIFRMQCALSSGKELAERKPKLKQLDQSVFHGADKRLSLAAIESNGRAYLFEPKAEFASRSVGWRGFGLYKLIGEGYDPTDWQSSLIERESRELTGSELCKAMLARGDKYILCLVGDGGDYRVANQGYAFIVTGVHSNGEFDTPIYTWEFAVPINNQGEPLTASEVGL